MPHLTDKPPVSFLMILLSFPLRNLFLNQTWGLIIVRVVSSLSVCLRLLFNYQIQITEIFAECGLLIFRALHYGLLFFTLIQFQCHFYFYATRSHS